MPGSGVKVVEAGAVEACDAWPVQPSWKRRIVKDTIGTKRVGERQLEDFVVLWKDEWVGAILGANQRPVPLISSYRYERSVR